MNIGISNALFVAYISYSDDHHTGMNENTLLTFAKGIKDFRLDRRKLHPVENIVFITILAVICNAQDWEEIEDFGNSRIDFFSKHLDLKNGVPSHDTFNRFFSLYDPRSFQALFVEWLSQLINIGEKHIAIDGKTCRGSKGSSGKMIHLLHAYLTDDHSFLGQEKTEEKSNEITAIPQLLKVLDLQGALVSIDAMGCQKEIASQVIEQKGDYLLAVKENQKTLYQDIESAFGVYKKEPTTYFETVEINGSRMEKRICRSMSDLSHIEQAGQWKDLSVYIEIETEVYHKSKDRTTRDKRYYISSRTATPMYFLKAVRNHWAIENNLHWSLDVIFGEDQSRKRNNNVTENFSIILKTALKILQEKQKANKKISIKRMRKMAAWNLEYLLQLLEF
jgi:predicted transposase YbfD/YdcC